MITIVRHMELVMQPSSLTAYSKYTQGPGNKQPNEIEASMTQFRESGADLLVLCSSDAEYFEQGKILIEQIKSTEGDIPVIIAGNPEGISGTGTDYTVHARMNRLEFLQELCSRWLR